MLDFSRMVTPVIVKVLYFIGVIVVVGTGISIMFGSVETDLFRSDAQIFLGLLAVAFAVLLMRVMAESVIVMFQISDTLTDIKEALDTEESGYLELESKPRKSNGTDIGEPFLDSRPESEPEPVTDVPEVERAQDVPPDEQGGEGFAWRKALIVLAWIVGFLLMILLFAPR